MKAYMVFTKEKTTNEAELKTYGEKIWPTFDGHDLKILVGYGQHEVLEGGPIEGMVILEFPSIQAAKSWYNSPGYQAIVNHRFNGAIYQGILASGFAEAVKPELERRPSLQPEQY